MFSYIFYSDIMSQRNLTFFIPLRRSLLKSFSLHRLTSFSSVQLHCSCSFVKRETLLGLLHTRPNCNLFNGQQPFSLLGRSYSKLYDSFDEQPVSWLFVSDAVAGAYGSQVNLDLDLERRLPSHEFTALKENVERRNIDFDLMSLVSDFQRMASLVQERELLNRRKENLLKQLKHLKVGKDKGEVQLSSDEINREIDKCKISSKDLMNHLWSIEDRLMTQALRLPNDLHPSTPLTQSVVLKERNSDRAVSCHLNHIEIAKKFDLIKFSNAGPKAYYLKNEMALAFRKLSDFTCDYFLHKNYRLVSGPEFFKTPILESCGRDFQDKHEVLTLKHSSRDIEPMNHLAGVSLMTFAAFVAKLCVGDSNLPMKMFSLGPTYQSSTDPIGLYGSTQTSQLGIFSCSPREDTETQYEEMVNTVWDFLSLFEFPIRLIQCCATELRREERRKAKIEIWIPSLHKYQTISCVSDVGDFVSRRQMSTHNKNHADIRHTKPLHMISGSAVNITALLGVWMEHSDIDTDRFCLKDMPGVFQTR